MITELEIEGFKSFGSPAEKLRPGALNFVVGANASGKTNLLSALRFLQNAIRQDVEYAVNDLGGNIEVRNKLLRQRREPKPVRFRIQLQGVDLTLPDKETKISFDHFEYEVTLNLRGEENVPVIESEFLRAPLTRNGHQQVFTLKRDTSKVTIRGDPIRAERSDTEDYPVPQQEATRLALGVGFFALPCVILREEIGRWRFYNISPNMARQPSREVPDIDLGPAGENLAVVLHKMEQDHNEKALDAIVTGLRGVVPGFKNIKTTRLPVEGKWAFQILEEKIRGAMNPASVSDGTIRLLALLVITTWMAKHSSLIAIEEPENGVHPHLAEHIVEIIRTASQKHQFFITTHNPSFLDYLEPGEVILCDKEEGFTKLKHASDVVDIEQFRKHFCLGDLWTQGTLGGIP